MSERVSDEALIEILEEDSYSDDSPMKLMAGELVGLRSEIEAARQIEHEAAALRAELAALKEQKPVAWRIEWDADRIRSPG